MRITLNYVKIDVSDGSTISDLMERFRVKNMYPLLNNLPVRGEDYDAPLKEGDSVKFIKTIIV